MTRSFLRSFRSLFNPSYQKIIASSTTVFLLTFFCIICLSSFKMIPSWEYWRWLALGVMATIVLLILSYITLLFLIKFQKTAFARNKTFFQKLKVLVFPISIFIIYGLFLFCFLLICFWITYLAFTGEKLIGQLNYPSYGKTIYVYAEKQCFFDCSLDYSFWLQQGWLPVTRKIATINIDNDYINPGSEKEKEIYETYLA